MIVLILNGEYIIVILEQNVYNYSVKGEVLTIFHHQY